MRKLLQWLKRRVARDRSKVQISEKERGELAKKVAELRETREDLGRKISVVEKVLEEMERKKHEKSRFDRVQLETEITELKSNCDRMKNAFDILTKGIRDIEVTVSVSEATELIKMTTVGYEILVVAQETARRAVTIRQRERMVIPGLEEEVKAAKLDVLAVDEAIGAGEPSSIEPETVKETSPEGKEKPLERNKTTEQQ